MERVVVRDGWRRIVLALLFLSSVISVALPGFATQSVSLGWDPSPDANVVGYNVYYGPASRSYNKLLVAGSATNIIVSGLVEGATYYFAATAYDVTGTESDYSNEVSYSVPSTNSASTNAAPFIIGLPNQTITVNSATTNTPFVIGDPDTAITKLTVWAACSNPWLVPLSNITISGSGSNRTCRVTPAPSQTGVAGITVYVSDDAGNTFADTFLLTVVASVQTTPLVITINGSGTVSPNLGAQTLTVGKVYSLTATPAAGQVFSGWNGSIVSSSAKLTFTLVSNMVLQANFIPSPYIPVSGSYNGLFSENAGVAVPSAGSFTASLTSGGAYSGKLQVAGKSSSFSGKMNLQLQATTSIKLGTNLISLVFQAGSGNQAGQISGQVTGGTWTSPLQGDRAMFNAKTNPAPQAGTYTMMIHRQFYDPLLPAGHSFGSVKVTTSGFASLAGTLADGTKISQSVPISQDGMWPLYVPLYSGKGLITSWQLFRTQSDTDFDGNLVWIKLTNSATRFYPAGFNYQRHVFGMTYIPPVGTNTVLDFSTADMPFSGGDLPASFANHIQLNAGNKITNLSSNKFTMSFSLSTGIFNGTVTDPVMKKSWTFSGAVLQKDNAGYGFLTGTNEASEVSLFPN